MKLAIDIEANALVKPDKIWVIVCKDLDTGEYHIFREVTNDAEAKKAFLALLDKCTLLVGHHILGYDLPVVEDLLQVRFEVDKSVDTYIVSKLANYSRPDGHSIQEYGLEFGLEKIDFSDFTKYSLEMEKYCVRDVDICERIYRKYLRYIHDCGDAILLESQFQLIVSQLHRNGFSFNTKKAEKLLLKVKEDLDVLDKEIEKAFPKRLRPVREVHPVYTKFGTLNKKDFRWVEDGDLSQFAGGPFTLCRWEEFNPASPKQVVDVLNGAGWVPSDKTKTHVDVEREINRIKFSRDKNKDLDLTRLSARLEGLKKYGWKINEQNLSTLPSSAPTPARTLAKRILLESRRRTLTEWLGLVDESGRIHGEFYGIGAWTHRMAHQKPNTANIPNAHKQDGSVKLLGKELRSLWQAPKERLLVGVDAEGIQLRIFAHYINDPEFTEALINGRKELKTDPHSLNKTILGPVCKTRDAAKRFIYALLLGAGFGKLTQILECSKEDAQSALDRVLERYQGFDYLKREVIPSDAKRGYFIGLDGRRVPILGSTVGERKHLCMSGYLQNGEAIIMKKATVKWFDLLKDDDAILVNLVHDEWQTEVPNNMEIALKIAKMQSDSLKEVGEELKLKCPLAGSYWNDDVKDYTIGTNWSVTH